MIGSTYNAEWMNKHYLSFKTLMSVRRSPRRPVASDSKYRRYRDAAAGRGNKLNERQLRSRARPVRNVVLRKK